LDHLSYKTISANASTVAKDWVLVDAQSAVLGRFVSEVAKILRGKNKPSFTPHVDCGDNVIIINAKGIRMTGKKWTNKVYHNYSGFPGGQKSITPKELMAKSPIKLLERSIKGMLPKNRLGDKLIHNVFIYEGAEHPHAAQQPKEIKL